STLALLAAFPYTTLFRSVQLVEDGLAWLGEAEHRQGVGDLLEGCAQAADLVAVLPIAAHEQVERILDTHQLLAQGGDHRANGRTDRKSTRLNSSHVKISY